MTPNIKVSELVVEATVGANITAALCEAILLCVTEDRTVVLYHNDKKYCVTMKKLLDAVYDHVGAGSR